MEAIIAHEASFAAEVNAPQLVTLYDRTGEPMQVPEERVQHWLAQGFTRKPVDLDSLASEVDALGDAIGAPWRAYVDACRTKGAIDDQAQAVAHQSLADFCQACDALHRAIHQEFGPAQQPDEEG
jgi:hypothetical protein